PAQPRPTPLQPGGTASAPADDVPMQLAVAIGQGDPAALGKLNEYSQMQHGAFRTNSAGLTNELLSMVSERSFGGLHSAFNSLADQAANGNAYARQAIDKAVAMPYLQGLAVNALGDLAGHGDLTALEVLLNPNQHGL